MTHYITLDPPVVILMQLDTRFLPVLAVRQKNEDRAQDFEFFLKKCVGTMRIRWKREK
jgi:hypothetical protein